MPRTLLAFAGGLAVLLALTPIGRAQTWNSPGMQPEDFNKVVSSGAAPRRDLTGIWDANIAGIGGSAAEAEREKARAPYTALGEQMARKNRPGNGPRMAPVSQINDPLSTMGDPTGFPRLITFELRLVQIAHTANQVLMLYMFEKRWRVIWTDGRQLPKDPDPRWYGYSVGRWEDDNTFVVETVGLDDRTWVDNSGTPHSTGLRVEERYHRVSQNRLELTVLIDDPKVYTKPWLARNRLPLKLMPPGTDIMEMIPSASEALAYRETIASQAK